MRWLSSWIRNELINAHPLILASVFGLLRRHTPFVRVGNTLIVLRQDDIRDLLSRPADFELGAVAEHKMLMGPFLLGLDPWPFYQSVKAELTVVLDNHHARARALTAENSANALNRVEQRVAGRVHDVDLIEDFAIPVLSRTAQDLTGVTPPEVHHLANDVPDVFEAVTRIVGSVVAVEQPAPFGLQWAGEVTAADFRIHLDGLVHSRWQEIRQNANGANRGNMLDELIWNASEHGQRPPCPDLVAQIRGKIAGLTLAAITPILKAYAHTIEQLLRRREWVIENQPALQVAAEAAADGRSGVVGSIIVEALRFHPVFPVLQRYAPRDTVIASGLDREYRVTAGTNVVVALLSGMFDDTTVERSEEFRVDRPNESYLHFGSGTHVCLGAAMATDILTEMVSATLRIPRFDQAEYVRAVYDGPAIAHLYVKT